MGWLKALFGAINGFFQAQERKANEEAGANKVKVAQLAEQAKIRKDADGVWRTKPRNRLQRDKGKSGD